MRYVTAFALAASLCACSNQVQLAYTPTGAILRQDTPAIGQVSAVDRRGESDPTWIGAVRGGFGNPLKTIHTARPAAEIVAGLFREALASRGLLAGQGAGGLELTIGIDALDGSKSVRSEANIDMTIDLRDRATGRSVYSDRIKSNPVSGNVFELDTGIFASPDDLREVVEKALDKDVDAALNNPAFLAALRQGPATAS